MTDTEIPDSLVGWLVYAVSIIITILLTGRKIGKAEAKAEATMNTIASEVATVRASVLVLQQKDLVEESDIRDFLTMGDHEKEQTTCRRELSLELARIQERNDAKIASISDGQDRIQAAIQASISANRAICDEIRILREALIRNGLEVKSKERMGDVL